MIKSHKETKTEEIEIIDDIICNKCGESLQHGNVPGFYGLKEYEIHGGWASIFGDGAVLKFSVCEKCLKEFIGTFKIEPEYREENF